MVIVPPHHQQQPVNPPIVQNCAYQIQIDTNPPTFQCYSQKEYTQMMFNRAEENNKEWNAFKSYIRSHTLFLVVIGFIVLTFIIGAFTL